MIHSIDVRVTTPVNDTEIDDRVVRAVRALFPDAEVEREDGRLVATGHSLDRLAEQLRDQRILDTARSAFRDAATDEGFAFDLKKQPALHGRVNFAVGNPSELGDLHVEVTVREPSVDAFVDYLAPATDEDGRPIDDPMA